MDKPQLQSSAKPSWMLSWITTAMVLAIIGASMFYYGQELQRAIWPFNEEDQIAFRTRSAIVIVVLALPSLHFLIYFAKRQQQRLESAAEEFAMLPRTPVLEPISECVEPLPEAAVEAQLNAGTAVLAYATPTQFQEQPQRQPYVPPSAIATAWHWVFVPQLFCIVIGALLLPALGRGRFEDPISLGMIWWTTFALYWASFIIIGKTRRSPMTEFDVFLIRFGFWFLLFGVSFALPAVRDAVV